MNSADRLELLLRSELRRADELSVEHRYDAVLTRSMQRTRRRWAILVAAAVVLAAAGVGGVLRLPLQPSPAPPPAVDRPHALLAGSWTRTVTGSDVGDGTWVLSFKEAPVLDVSGPPDRPSQSVTDGASYELRRDQLRVNIFVNGACGENAPVGRYRWTIGSGLLYLELVRDDCTAREELLVGTWVQRP